MDELQPQLAGQFSRDVSITDPMSQIPLPGFRDWWTVARQCLLVQTLGSMFLTRLMSNYLQRNSWSLLHLQRDA